jgi:NMD protein affecting ribosome stability and mRNA decay
MHKVDIYLSSTPLLHEYFFMGIIFHMRVCHACGQQIDKQTPIVRSAVCPSCDKDLKVCLNCEFYSPGSHWECRESIGERVAEKDKANFCDFFRFKEGTESAAGKHTDKKAKEDFFKLFDNE